MKIGDIAGTPAQQRAEYTKALEMSGGLWGLQAIARTYGDEHDFPQKRATLGRMLALPDLTTGQRADVYIDIAQSFEQERKFEEARADYGKVQKIENVSAYYPVYAHFLTAKNYLANDHPDLAKLEFQKVVSLASPDAGGAALAAEAERQLKSLP
jgi:hypothetical protein